MFAHVISSAILFVGATGSMAAQEAGEVDSPRAVAQLSFHEYSRSADESLRAEALARSPREKAGPVRTLCQLHEALRHDARTEKSEYLQELENKLFLRLRKVKADLEKQLAKEAKAGDSKSSRSTSDASLLAQAAQATVPGARGGGLVDDQGQELVDLIERTIQPDVWDVNGGRATIVYYAPLQVLVVSAPAEVHGDLGGVLQGLRAAGP